jgi:hypothetical protein
MNTLSGDHFLLMKSTKSAFIVLFLIILSLPAQLYSFPCSAGGDEQRDPGKKPPEPTFRKTVLPILRLFCLPCHAEENMNPSELNLDSYENLLKGGSHGRTIVPGKADESLLIRKFGPNPPFGRPMPLKISRPFPDDTLQLLRQWIDAGAKND